MLRISTNPLDASAWETAVDLDTSFGLELYTYSNPVQLTDETNDPIYLFFRSGNGAGAAQYYAKSDDGGGTWAAPVQWLVAAAGRPYLKLAKTSESRIDFLITNGHPTSISTSLYHGYYEAGNWYQSDGTLVGDVGDMPFAPSDFTLVYDGSTVRGWDWDIARGADGHPRVLFAIFPETTDHRYYYGRWTGTAWVTTEICTGGTHLYADERYYSGGLSFDHDTPDRVFASRESGGAWNIWRYTTTDNGVTWAGTALTTGSGTRIRPYVVAGASEPKLLYLSGTYTTYSDYNMRIVIVRSDV